MKLTEIKRAGCLDKIIEHLVTCVVVNTAQKNVKIQHRATKQDLLILDGMNVDPASYRTGLAQQA